MITKSKINEIFNKSCKDNNNNKIENDADNDDNILKMNFEQFKYSLITISMELHKIKKHKLLKCISEQKNKMNYMELKECQRQEEEKEHNKFTEKNTGGIAKKSWEKNQYDYISKHKKLKEEIIKNEYDYEKESKKSDIEILSNFYKYIGIDINSKYKNNLKTKINRFFKFLKNYKINIQKNDRNDIKTLRGNLIKYRNNNNIERDGYSLKSSRLNNNESNELRKDVTNSFLSSRSKNYSVNQKIFENSNIISWNQIESINCDYNPINENNNIINNDTDSDVDIFKKLNESKKNKKISPFNLKSIGNNILPIIKTNNRHQNCNNNSRYYY